MSTLAVNQLQSKHFKRDGKFCIEYTFTVSGYGYFSDLAILWEGAVDTNHVNITPSQRTASYVVVSNNRAIKYNERELEFIFGDLLVVGSHEFKGNTTPDKYKVVGY